MKSLKISFQNFCKINNFELNSNQIKIVNSLKDFLYPEKKIFNLLFKKKNLLCFYLSGSVGVGKTMILNFVFESLSFSKKKFHFNEFMIQFHDFRHQMKKENKKNSIGNFVKKLKKFKLIYLDEFQVTNIVDAMILGKLFEHIFAENIKIIITTNIPVDDLYKDGLQREQFLPFISIIKRNSIEKELILENDYRKLGDNKLKRAFFPNNEKNLFQINQIFRSLTKNKNNTKLKLNIKGRYLEFSNYFEGIIRFDFKQLCDVNFGAEDYLSIAEKCKFVVIENIPKFNNENSNQQKRFITLIDIFYEKKIPLMISISTDLNNLGTSNLLSDAFKRTLSRLYELTSPKFHYVD